MPVIKSDSTPLRTERDIVLVRQCIRKISQEIGFRLVDQTKIVTAASELARNTVVHGRGGVLVWEYISDTDRLGLRLTFTDEGPGIADLDLAMKDGWSSGHGLGMGLSGARRLVNEFELQSRPGLGTRVAITKWK